jgi:tetratricopeptide (TPR) repeat protein
MNRTTALIPILVVSADYAEAAIDQIRVVGPYFGRYQHAHELLNAGNTELRRNNYQKAQSYFEEAIKSEPTFWLAS